MQFLNADPLETKKLLDKLVVLKLNGSLGTKLGFNGPRYVYIWDYPSDCFMLHNEWTIFTFKDENSDL